MVARSVEYLVRIDADPRVMATFGTFIRRLSLIYFFFFFSGLCCGLTSLSTSLVIPGQNRRFQGIKRMEKEIRTDVTHNIGNP